MTAKIDLLREAAKARTERRYADACKIYGQVLEAFGPDADVMWGVAQSEFALSIVSPDAEDTHGYVALHWVERAIALNPRRADYHYALGDMLEHVGAPNYEAAARAYRQALQIQPCFAPALSRLAMLYEVPEHVVPLEEAISCCERALQVEPTRSLWLVLADLYRYAGRSDDSLHAETNSLLERREIGPMFY